MMRKQHVVLSAATALTSLAFVLAPASVTAAAVEPAISPASVSSSTITPLACRVGPRPGVSAVNVRLRPDDDSTRLGIIQRGQSAAADCSETTGQPYTACGGTNSRRWIGVTWNGRRGYVARYCVDWWRV